jgi:processive 1,2-diacylglycerol beta-glucosyltransferase
MAGTPRMMSLTVERDDDAKMYRLIDLEHDEEIGVITEEQVQFLVDNLEEEGIEDQDYYIDEEVLRFLEENGCDEELLTSLRETLEGRLSIDIRYELI